MDSIINPKFDKKLLLQVASDATTDLIYSYITDVFNKFVQKGIITHDKVDEAISAIEEVNQEINLNGIRLRRATIDRRIQDRKKAPSKASRVKKELEWKNHPFNDNIKYSPEFTIRGKYPLIIEKDNKKYMVGLLSKNELENKKTQYGLINPDTLKLSGTDILLAAKDGFLIDDKYLQDEINKRNKVKEEPEVDDNETEVSSQLYDTDDDEDSE
jgi:hypothetical protein